MNIEKYIMNYSELKARINLGYMYQPLFHPCTQPEGGLLQGSFACVHAGTILKKMWKEQYSQLDLP